MRKSVIAFVVLAVAACGFAQPSVKRQVGVSRYAVAWTGNSSTKIVDFQKGELLSVMITSEQVKPTDPKAKRAITNFDVAVNVGGKDVLGGKGKSISNSRPIRLENVLLDSVPTVVISGADAQQKGTVVLLVRKK